MQTLSTQTLSPENRLRLLRFACAFAWADLRVTHEERDFILELVRRFQVPDADRAQVEQWLSHPPSPEDVDPLDIPLEHRRVFVQTAMDTIRADRFIDLEEMESFHLFETLLYAAEE